MKEFTYAGRRQQKLREEDMVRTRLIMWASIAPHSNKKITPKDLIEIPSIDHKRVISKATQEKVLRAWKDL